MKPKTTKDDLEIVRLMDWELSDRIYADLCTLHAEAEREAEIQRVFEEYDVGAGPDYDVTWCIQGNSDLEKYGLNVFGGYKTRRACDDALLAAVHAHEQKESVSK